jgi:hypothetical protein
VNFALPSWAMLEYGGLIVVLATLSSRWVDGFERERMRYEDVAVDIVHKLFPS